MWGKTGSITVSTHRYLVESHPHFSPWCCGDYTVTGEYLWLWGTLDNDKNMQGWSMQGTVKDHSIYCEWLSKYCCPHRLKKAQYSLVDFTMLAHNATAVNLQVSTAWSVICGVRAWTRADRGLQANAVCVHVVQSVRCAWVGCSGGVYADLVYLFCICFFLSALELCVNTQFGEGLVCCGVNADEVPRQPARAHGRAQGAADAAGDDRPNPNPYPWH